MPKKDLKKSLTTPEQVYENPSDVTEDQTLDVTTKIDILNAWKTNEEALLRASNEGMVGGERPHLDLVVKELAKLRI